MSLWAIKWRSKNHIDGDQQWLMLFHRGEVSIFRTRAAARAFRDDVYGYIRNRPDLRKEPHGWTLPSVVKIQINEVDHA